MPQSDIIVPKFGRTVIESDRKDGYWVETFPFGKDEIPGLIA